MRGIAIKKAFENPELEYRIISAGAYFAYVKHPFDDSARNVVKRLIQDHQIVCLPGSYFGDGQDDYIRLAYANVHESLFDEVVQRLIASQ